MAGKSFSRWTVKDQAGNAPGGGALWNCVCTCGTERAVMGADLRNGKSISCGCHRADVIGALNRTHGQSQSRLHQTWSNMRARCGNPNRPGYADYGGRGITVCAEWADFAAFRNWAMANGYADDLTIERINVNGDYEPENCTFIPKEDQAANRRMVLRAPDGELWWHKAKKNGISRAAYAWRLGEGWSQEEATTWPQGKRRVPRQRGDDGKFV